MVPVGRLRVRRLIDKSGGVRVVRGEVEFADEPPSESGAQHVQVLLEFDNGVLRAHCGSSLDFARDGDKTDAGFHVSIKPCGREELNELFALPWDMRISRKPLAEWLRDEVPRFVRKGLCEEDAALLLEVAGAR